jgi:hypothetical protein
MEKPHPNLRAILLYGESVKPAMGASTSGLPISIKPSFTFIAICSEFRYGESRKLFGDTKCVFYRQVITYMGRTGYNKKTGVPAGFFITAIGQIISS